MALTLGDGPLASRSPDTVNYRIDGPEHRLFWHRFPRRIRALLGDQVVVDSTRANLLHESNLLPQLYFPRSDIRIDLLETSRRRTHCVFKGDAAYESVRVGEQFAENAVWTYPNPTISTAWLTGHSAIHWDSMDAWFDEDEEVFGHIRDPYHRIDIRRTSRHVRIDVGDTIVASSRRALLLSETGLPNRFYLPPADIHAEYLIPSAKHTVCAYKGNASYRTLHINGTVIRNAAWFYPEPLQDARQIANHLCFFADGVHIWVDAKLLD